MKHESITPHRASVGNIHLSLAFMWGGVVAILAVVLIFVEGELTYQGRKFSVYGFGELIK